MQLSIFAQSSAYCSMHETCVYDMREKLAKWNCLPSEAEEIIERLIAEKYIDEQRYATAYVRDKYRFNKWGRLKIRHMLKSKNISEPDINGAMEAIDPETYMNILESEISKKQKSIKGGNPYEIKQKLLRFAVSRGYEYNIIEKAIK